MAGEAAGEDRRVVGERDRRQAGHRAPLVGGAHRHEARDVRCLARRRHGVEHVGVHAVEQEADDVARPTAGDVEHVVAHDAVLPGEVVAAVVGRAPEELGDGGRDVDETADARDQAVVAHALARDHERRAGLHDAERAVLAAVAALVLPVVRGRVEHAQVGRGRVVEELRDVVVRVGVRVGGAGRVRIGALGVDAHEPVGRLVGERVRAGHAGAFVAVGSGTRAAERDRAVGARDLVGAVVSCGAPPCRRSAPTARRAARRARGPGRSRRERYPPRVKVASPARHLSDVPEWTGSGGGDAPDGAGAAAAVGDDVERCRRGPAPRSAGAHRDRAR